MDRYKQLEGWEPQQALRRFWDISMIPRVPGIMRPISDYLADYIRVLGLEVTQDDHWNVIARKPASPGYEKAPVVMLQSHMDMVCEKDPGVEHDFAKGSLKLRIDEKGKVTAVGTTLGADDGVGVAVALSILEDRSLRHPELEVVFTADEETDMNGAASLDFRSLRAKHILNLDSRPVQVCGAGEMEFITTIPKKESPVHANSALYTLTVDGLQGGHTGGQAMLERGNAIVLLNRILLELDDEMSYQIIDISGGADMSTAFARTATSEIAFPKEQLPKAQAVVKSWEETFKVELKIRDPEVKVSFLPSTSSCSAALSDETASKVKAALALLPDGVLSLNHEFKDAMESCSNVGIIRVEADQVWISTTIRSTIASKKHYAYRKAQLVCGLLGAGCEVVRDLPQWDYSLDDKLLEIIEEVYDGCEITISQGTLEGGIFVNNMPGVSFVALAPPYYNAHSPREYFLIDEFKECYDRLLALLSRMKS